MLEKRTRVGGGHVGTVDDVRDVLKDHGLRYSRPRQVILEFMLEENKHVSAEGLYLSLKHRGEELSLSTVYLNLSVLASSGLVREFKGAAGQSLYDSNVTPHYHVVCKETGEILDVPAPVIDGKPLGRYLKETIEAATGWIVDEPRLSLGGLSPTAAARHERSRVEGDEVDGRSGTAGRSGFAGPDRRTARAKARNEDAGTDAHGVDAANSADSVHVADSAHSARDAYSAGNADNADNADIADDAHAAHDAHVAAHGARDADDDGGR